jgi:hypothetical protein
VVLSAEGRTPGVSSSSGAEAAGASAGQAPESLRESLALLPRRAVFLAVALVQIAVELTVATLRDVSVGRSAGRRP